jgi:hypothetical protein
VLFGWSGGLAVPESFFCAFGTTEVAPFPNRALRQSRLPPFFAKNAKKGWGTRLVGTMCKTGIYGTRLMGSVRRDTKWLNEAKRGVGRFVLCVRNEGYPAGLELRKVYPVLADEQASKLHQLRVIDESGEDYLYPEEYFVFITLPIEAEIVVLAGAKRKVPRLRSG